MWFRMATNTGNGDDTAAGPNNSSSSCTIEKSKFDKFRRTSFRRKSASASQSSGQRKRSKSPHVIAAALTLTTNEVEENEENLRDDITKVNTLKNGESEVVLKPNKSERGGTKKEKITETKQTTASTKKTPLVPILTPLGEAVVPVVPSVSTSLGNISNKSKLSKRKFYTKISKNSNDGYKNLKKHDDNSSEQLEHIKDVDVGDDNENDDDDGDDDDDVDTNTEDEDLVDNVDHKEIDENRSPSREKEKILLTGPKFKHNRIQKSSSKTKIVGEIDRRESLTRSRSGRKISAPSVITDIESNKKHIDKKEATRSRAHSNLNLQSLLTFVVRNKKFLFTNEDANLTTNVARHKSVSKAANTMIAVPAGCKPMPIALKYPKHEGVVAESPQEHDAKTDRNVVLMRKQSLKDTLCEKTNYRNHSKNTTASIKETQSEKGKNGKSFKRNGKKLSKLNRNSSNSSKSSGNFEDEAFYSCDESEKSKGYDTLTDIATSPEEPNWQEKRKVSSTSLTSRVAAKINETTNNYKNRRAAAAASKFVKKRKSAPTASELENVDKERLELYKPISAERQHLTSIVRQPSDRRPDASNVLLRTNGSAAQNSSDLLHSSYHGPSAGANGAEGAVATSAGGAAGGVGAAMGGVVDTNAQDAEHKETRKERLYQQHLQNKSAPNSVNRSESYKERLSAKRDRNSRRKTSDPSLSSRQNDEQGDLALSNSNYTASSNSSLSSGGGSESPSTSMEQVGVGSGPTSTQQQHGTHGHHPHVHHAHQHSHHDSFHGSIGGSSSNASFWSGSIGGAGGPTIGQLARQWNFESDEEDDLNEADWSSNVAAEVLAALTDAEKKRQEIINEIYQTERSHVRTLKLLERLFFYPLQDSGLLSNDHLALLFPPALLSLRELHGAFEQQLKQRRFEHNHIVNHVGDLLAGMFDGQSGDELREFAAQFCARQQIALEALKEKRRKDEQLQKLLSKAESHKACRRLQLKDLLPTVLQRLTKYPLLFENLYKVTIRVVPENATEAEAIQRALESSKKILVDVNQAVKTAEDAHKLQNIQRKLDKSTFDKDEFKNLDLTQYRLIHDGSLTMKKNPSIQLHGLLFENMIVLLTKQDDKYSLKYLQAARNTEVNNKPVNPIMSIDSETLVRQEAADKNSFFLIKTKTSQMLELRATSSSECKTWFKHISDAAEQYKPRSKNANANHEPIDDPAISTIPHSNTRESLEPTPERPPPISATATVTTTPLAPMMPLPMASVSVTIAQGSNNNSNEVQLRRGRRESTPASSFPDEGSQKQQLSPTSVNRTMSTRSCGDASNSNSNNAADGVTLRHTQSAREASATSNESSVVAQDNGASILASSNRNSTSIVTSNNSNNTRTLMQSTPPLVEPSAIQISISPAHTAEPVLTPAERLRRLDASIRDDLLEKQRIICDMFRLPVEHFHEIIDIATMPEAPKDSSDIALAAYAQVQSLTEVLNEYMIATPEQQVSAVSTSVCDHCHQKQRKNAPPISAASTASTSRYSSSSLTTQIDVPPPLPPPNNHQQAQQQTPAPMAATLQTSSLLDSADVHEDDDGYCEIDELRLPALPPLTTAKSKPSSLQTSTSPPTSTTTTVTTEVTVASSTAPTTSAANAELLKRHSTISNTDSIPEETADDVKHSMDEANPNDGEAQSDAQKKDKEKASMEERKSDKQTTDAGTAETATTSSTTGEPQRPCSADSPASSSSEQSDFTDALSTLNKLNITPSMIDGTTQTLFQPLYMNTNAGVIGDIACSGSLFPLCGPNRIQHANSLEPSIPCHALNGIVSALNAQISLLLPKISERDMERDRLRKENQHLRELLSSMHERQRVEDKLATPIDIASASASAVVATAAGDNEIAADEEAKDNSTTVTTPEVEA